MKVIFKIIVLFSFITFILSADGYQMGQGLKIDDRLHLGGYFSTNYTFSNGNNQFELDDVAFLAYGSLTSRLSYFVELEAAPYYIQNFNTQNSTLNRKFHYERLYFDYSISEMFNLRIGKQITPIGYWNIEPINVLRDTSSNPLYSRIMFPKFLTGIDIYGYLDNQDTLNYHLFIQNNKDIDGEFTNIKNDYFYGFNLNFEPDDYFSYGTTIGRYKIKESQQTVNFIQANMKYDNYPFLCQTEWAFNSINEKSTNTKSYQFSGYIQGEYNINQKHAIVSRYEYIDYDITQKENHIGIIGYSYRPIYSISIKTEYQINSDSNFNKAILSFSVLF